MKYNSGKKGFTLIELLVVIAIVGILATVVYVGIGNQREKTRDSKRKSDIVQIKLALEYYYEFYGFVPTTAPNEAETSRGVITSLGIACAGTTGTNWDGNIINLETGNFTGDLPTDPINSTNNCYIYLSNAPENGQPRGACIWTTLESETGASGKRKVGAIVGKPGPDAGGYPTGYKCNFLDEVLLGGVKPSGTGASGT